MTEEARLRRKAKDHEYYERTKERRKQYQREYYQRNKQRVLLWHRCHRLKGFAKEELEQIKAEQQ